MYNLIRGYGRVFKSTPKEYSFNYLTYTDDAIKSPTSIVHTNHVNDVVSRLSI